MATDRVNAVNLGPVKDKWGFPGELIEDPLSKRRWVAYSIEVWMERARFLSTLASLKEEKDGLDQPQTPASD